MTVWSECVLYVVERSDCVRPRMVTSGPASASGGQPTWTLRAFNCVMGRVCVVGGAVVCVLGDWLGAKTRVGPPRVAVWLGDLGYVTVPL